MSVSKDDLISIAEDATTEGRHREAARILAEVYQVPTSTGEPTEQHCSTRCGITPRINVSMRTRLVQCAVCFAELDPLDILRSYARRERMFAFQMETLRREFDDLRGYIMAAKRELANLKASIKRAKKGA